MTGWTSVSVFLHLFLTTVSVVNSLPGRIMLGALFEEGEYLVVENAFRYAVYRINHDRQLLPDTILNYEIQRVPVTDHFRGAKRVCRLVEKNVATAFGRLSPQNSQFVKSLSAMLQIPHVELNMDQHIANSVNGLTVNVSPSSVEFGKAIVDLINFFRWEDVMVVFDRREELTKVRKVIGGEFSRHVDVIIRHIEVPTMRAVLKQCKSSRWRNILVNLDIDMTALFLKMALQEGMVDDKYNYLLTTLDIENIDIEDFRHNSVNITGLRLVDTDDIKTKKVIQEMEIYELQTDLIILNRTGYKSLPHEAALIYDAVYMFAHALELYDKKSFFHLPNASCNFPSKWSQGENLYTYLNQVPYKGLTGNLRLNSGRRHDSKFDILQLNDKGLSKIGTWTSVTGVDTNQMTRHPNQPYVNKTLIATSVLVCLKHALYRDLAVCV